MDDSQHKKVREWLMKAPFDDPGASTAPDFSYENWFEEGRSLPKSTEILIEFLEQEDLDHPSGDGMRIAYALGWIGEKKKDAVDALLRSLNSKDIALRVEATAALGRLGDASVLPTLEMLLKDPKEDINVRANACISIGRLGYDSSEPLLRNTMRDSDPFLVRCAEKALGMLKQK